MSAAIAPPPSPGRLSFRATVLAVTRTPLNQMKLPSQTWTVIWTVSVSAKRSLSRSPGGVTREWAQLGSNQ